MKTIDFARSSLTFRIDTLKKPSQTVRHKPPFTLNDARIPIECRGEITAKETNGGVSRAGPNPNRRRLQRLSLFPEYPIRCYE